LRDNILGKEKLIRDKKKIPYKLPPASGPVGVLSSRTPRWTFPPD